MVFLIRPEQCYEFGAAVIIDPVWSVESLGIRCSRNFCHVLEQLTDSIPKELDPTTDERSARVTLELLHERGKYALLCIAKAIQPDPASILLTS